MRATLTTLFVIMCGFAVLGCGGDDETSTAASESLSTTASTATEPATTAATESTEAADPGATGGDAQALIDNLSATASSFANCVDITNESQPVDGDCLATALGTAESQAGDLADQLQTLADGDDPACATAADEAKAGAESFEADLRELAEQASSDPSGITAASLTELVTGQVSTATQVANALTACATS